MRLFLLSRKPLCLIRRIHLRHRRVVEKGGAAPRNRLKSRTAAQNVKIVLRVVVVPSPIHGEISFAVTVKVARYRTVGVERMTKPNTDKLTIGASYYAKSRVAVFEALTPVESKVGFPVAVVIAGHDPVAEAVAHRVAEPVAASALFDDQSNRGRHTENVSETGDRLKRGSRIPHQEATMNLKCCVRSERLCRNNIIETNSLGRILVGFW